MTPPLGLLFFIAFFTVLGLIGLTAWMVRRFGAERLTTAVTRIEQLRRGVFDATVVRGVICIFWKESFEFCHRPSIPLGLLAISLLVVWTSGKINVEEPKVGAYLYKDSLTPETLAATRAILEEFSRLSVTEKEGDFVDADDMQRSGASMAIIYRDGHWLVLYRSATAVQEADAAQVAGLIAYSLNQKKPLSALLIDPEQPGVAGFSSRMSALPGELEKQLVPRTLALIIVFLPFVLAARSYTREVAYGTLAVLVGLPHVGWRPMAAGKVLACLWIVLAILLCVFLALEPLFGFSPKPGLTLQLAVQTLAILASACLGLLLAVIARSKSQVYIFIAAYFFALVLLSGFLFPLETAAPVVRLASFVSPLTFSSKILENWLFFGTSPTIFPGEILWLAFQAAAAALLLDRSMSFAHRRI